MSFKEIIKNVFMNKGDNKMKEVVEFLQANPVQYLATVGRDGKAKCRPFMFCLEQEGKYGSVQITPRMCIRIFKQTQN